MQKITLTWITILLLCLPPSLRSQNSVNCLLWRISGNGLEKPSYVFGTMHLNDQRLFNLGDSLYDAIGRSDGFAIELNPYAISLLAIEEIKKEIKDKKHISEILSQKDYDQYGPSLEKKFHKSRESITSEDLIKEKNKWITERFRTGEMQTFLDAYLFDVARREGKWTGGVEDMEDQQGILTDIIDKTDIEQILASGNGDRDDELGKLIEIYNSQDIYSLYKMSSTGDSLGFDRVVVRRNHKMAFRMDSLSRVRSMVFAVGAAHLAGNEGVIELLRKRGFEVVPVISSRKIKSADYKVRDLPQEWKTVKDEMGLFEVSMPGEAASLKLFGIMEMKVVVDIFNSNAYFVTAVPAPYDENRMDSMARAMADLVFPGKARRKEEMVTVNGATGKSYSQTNNDGYKKGYILRKSNVLYIAVAASSKKIPASPADLERFLSSFKVFSPVADKKIGYLFKDSLNGFQVVLPAKPQLMNDMQGNKTGDVSKPEIYVSVDGKTGAYYLVGVNTIAPGRYIENDSIYIREVESNATGKNMSLVRDTSYLKNGYRVLQVEGRMKANGLWAVTRYFLRGNRWYALITIYDSLGSRPAYDDFFDSFEMLDYPSIPWAWRTSQDSLFASWAPANIHIMKGDDSDKSTVVLYNAFDSIQALGCDVVSWTLPKYYWSNSDSAFWESRMSSRISENDSLLYKKAVSNGEAHGWEFIKRQKGSRMYLRQRILLFGDSLYTLVVCNPLPVVTGENVNRFFESFRFNRPVPVTHLLSSKSRQLLRDLSSPDSATVVTASNYLEDANFEKADLPLLQEALLKPGLGTTFGLVPSSVYGHITDKIILLADSGSFRFAAGKYSQVPDSEAVIKNSLLMIMSAFPSKDHFLELFRLMVASPPGEDLSRDFINNLSSGGSITAGLIPQILPLMKVPQVQGSMIDLLGILLDSSLIEARLLTGQVPAFIEYAENRLKCLSKDKDNYDRHDRGIIKLLGLMKTTSCNNELHKWLAVRDGYLRTRVIEYLLRNNQTVQSAILQELAADKSNRTNLYNTLKDCHKASLFPAEYYTQMHFAESFVYDMASGDNDVEDIRFLGKKNADFSGKPGSFYFFRLKYTGDEKGVTHLVCAGPYDVRGSSVESPDADFQIYEDEPYDAKKLATQMAALLKQMQREKQDN
jgi:uncharacterized protein YbaP (TraB family)